MQFLLPLFPPEHLSLLAYFPPPIRSFKKHFRPALFSPFTRALGKLLPSACFGMLAQNHLPPVLVQKVKFQCPAQEAIGLGGESGHLKKGGLEEAV